MARPQYIRHNPVTLEWEHWVSTRVDMSSSIEDIDDFTKGYWVPSLYGQLYGSFGYLIPTQSFIDVFANSTKINLYETVNSGLVSYQMLNTFQNYDNLKKAKNLSIKELIDTSSLNEDTPYKPKIIYYSLQDNDTIKIAINSNLYVISNVLNPLNDNLKYKWLIDDQPIESNISNIQENQLLKNIDFKKESEFKLQVSNTAGVTESNTTIIIPYDLKNNKKFGKNLISNIDGKTSLSGWLTTEGTPRVGHFWEPISQNGRGDTWETFVGRAWTDEILKPNFNVIGPHYNDIFYPDWTPETFFEGGVDEDNPYSNLYYDIDLNDVVDVIDRKILNVDNVVGKLFAYLGGSGNEIFMHNENWDWFGRMFQPYNMDRVELRIHMLDENDNIINQDYFIYNPFTDRRYTSLFLRNIDFYIPIGSRKIRIWMKFTRCHSYTHYMITNLNIFKANIPNHLIQPMDDSNTQFELYTYNTYDNNKYIWAQNNQTFYRGTGQTGESNINGDSWLADYYGTMNQAEYIPDPIQVALVSQSVYTTQSIMDNILSLYTGQQPNSAVNIMNLQQSASAMGINYNQVRADYLTYSYQGLNYWDWLLNQRLMENNLIPNQGVTTDKLSDYLIPYLNGAAPKNRGYSIENDEFVFKHMTMATGINFYITVDNYTPYDNSRLYNFNQYEKQINLLDIGPLEPWNGLYTERILRPPMNLIYGSLYDKISDLNKLGIINKNEQINKIKESNFFTTKYTNEEIVAAVNGQSLELENYYNIRKNNNRFYI